MKRALLFPGIVIVACLARGAGAQDASGPARNTGRFGTSTWQQPDDRVRRGLVLVEQHGAPIAVGTILGRDGRVLTALSGLAGAAAADLLYADGSTVHAQVERSDKASDLALLVPQMVQWKEGLDASDIDPTGAVLREMLPSRSGQLGSSPAEVRGDVAAHGQRGQPTVRMLDVNVKALPTAGAPLLDPGGHVVAVIVHACKVIPVFPPGAGAGGTEPLPLPPPPCVPEPLGAPVEAIRAFLAGAAAPVAPWLGIRGQAEKQGNARGVRVLATAPSSAAEKAGLRPNADVIVAVDGQAVDTPERLAAIIGRHAVGETVKLIVLSDAGFRDVPVRLTGDSTPR